MVMFDCIRGWTRASMPKPRERSLSTASDVQSIHAQTMTTFMFDCITGHRTRTPDTGHRTLATGHRPPVTGHRTPNHRTPAIRHLTPATGHWTWDAGHRTPAPATGHRTPARPPATDGISLTPTMETIFLLLTSVKSVAHFLSPRHGRLTM